MSLRELAESDLSFVLEDAVTGFGWPITLINPEGVPADLIGKSSDIAQVIDPDTGVAVSGRAANISLRTSSLLSKGIGVPTGITESSLRPWVVKFDDINGASHVFKVLQSNPDRGLGVVTCLLELYLEWDGFIRLEDTPVLTDVPELDVVPL